MSSDPHHPSSRTVVIGGGQAGFSFCAKLRELGYRGELSLVCEESVGPYQRPPLSKAYLLGEMTADRLQFRSEEFYRDNSIDLRTSLRATAISPADGTVTLSDGRSLPFDHLVLATGARPRRLPPSIGGELAGIYYMRNLEDADALALACTAGRRVLIVGGGYIGLEAAAVAAKLGAEVTLIEATDRILQRVAAPQTSNYIRQIHQSHSVSIREGIGLASLAGSAGRVTSANLTDGSRLDVDLVVAGIGIVPNDDLARQAGLACANGIVTDALCRTSDPRIMAIGDCASIPHGGGYIRLESVGHAIDHGEAAAAALMGTETGYRPRPWFWSDQYDLKLQIAGLSTGYDRIVARGAYPDPTSYWYFAGLKLVAVDAMNDSRAYMVGKRLIETGRSPSPEAIADPETNLKALIKA